MVGWKDKSVITGCLSAILAAALFGSVSTIAKPIVSNLNPLLVSSMVYLISALALTPMAQRAKGQITKKHYGLIIAIAICGGLLGPSLFFLGLQQSLASDTALLSNGEIVFSVLLALLFFKERLRPIGFVAVGMVLSGIVIVTTNLQFSPSLFEINAGNLLILGATFFWALDNNLERILSDRMDVAKIVQLKSALGGAMLLGVIVSLQIPLQISLTEIPYVILLSLLGFAGSIYFFLQSLKRIGTIRTVVIFSTSSLFGLAFAFIFLHESISTYQIIAITVMLIGIYLINKNGSTEQRASKVKDSIF